MASVSSLDTDMRNLRMSRYTPQAAAEARAWIESTLGTPLASGDLLHALKDGVALCQLANLVIQPQHGAIKFKASSMPFIQMENISHFLKACELPPLSLPAHDRFLTVDLFEQKDPAQVLQCLGAFSRQANKINPNKVHSVIGPKPAGSAMSPTNTGGNSSNGGWRRAPSPTKAPANASVYGSQSISPSLTGGSAGSQWTNEASSKSPPASVSSWSKRSDESSTAPAWNIHQYGYMGGASQGNQGVSFGARRQITTQAPAVPSLAEKQKLRKEKEAEAERLRQQETLDQERRQRAAERQEEQARLDEERRWGEETRRLRDEERKQIEQQKREWEEQERKWREAEDTRKKEDAELQASVQKVATEKPQVPSSNILRGQNLSEWQRQQAGTAKTVESDPIPAETPEQRRVRELEQQLEEARERERQYQAEREDRLRESGKVSQQTSIRQEPIQPQSSRESDLSWAGDERDYLRQQYQISREGTPAKPAPFGSSRPLPSAPKPTSSLPPQQPTASFPARTEPAPPSLPTKPAAEPEQAPEAFVPGQRQPNRTEQFLATHSAPSNTAPRISSSREAGQMADEQSQLHDTRMASQQNTKAGAWASKSLLEREMERERERQREWEANQQTLKSAPRDQAEGTGEGQTWDVNQYGYLGGDNMNRGSSVGSGINIGGRRQIVGPRPQP